MKAKNALGHYTRKKEAAENHVHRWRILPILLCLLLAVVFWLIVKNFNADPAQKTETQNQAQTQTQTQ